MGAWGYFPMENDEALDWANAFIEKPLLRAISKALRAFSAARRPSSLKKIEAEAAISLLVFFATHSDKQYCGIDFKQRAREDGLWTLADLALERLLDDTKYLSDWSKPEEKKRIWSRMREMIPKDPDAPPSH